MDVQETITPKVANLLNKLLGDNSHINEKMLIDNQDIFSLVFDKFVFLYVNIMRQIKVNDASGIALKLGRNCYEFYYQQVDSEDIPSYKINIFEYNSLEHSSDSLINISNIVIAKKSDYSYMYIYHSTGLNHKHSTFRVHIGDDTTSDNNLNNEGYGHLLVHLISMLDNL